VKDLSKSHSLDPKWINDGVKGFPDDLSPDFQKRLLSLNEEFENLHVFIISKPDLITMKICAWREADKEGYKELAVHLHKRRIGLINRLGGDRYLFSFEQDYIDDSNRTVAAWEKLAEKDLLSKKMRGLVGDQIFSVAKTVMG
jgi:hypothetical protein